jgi:predicted Fe-Mo cluster-binding NifX family protein
MNAMDFLLALIMAVAAKIAITSAGPNPESNVEPQFGRAPWFMIYDPGTSGWQAVDNSNTARAPGGAGREAAEALARRGVRIVITGQCGPNALRALSSAGIRIFQGSDRTVAAALRDYEAGKLRELK